VVSWTKPTFRGRDALAAERERGVARSLRGIATVGRRPPRAECPVIVAGEPAGETTSGNFSPVLGHGIALAFLPPDIEDGAAVQVDLRGTALEGTVVATPFVPSG
jgi:aminomethyltransferase